MLSSAYKSKLTHFQGIQSVSILDTRPHENKQLSKILNIFGLVAKRKHIRGGNCLEQPFQSISLLKKNVPEWLCLSFELFVPVYNPKVQAHASLVQ